MLVPKKLVLAALRLDPSFLLAFVYVLATLLALNLVALPGFARQAPEPSASRPTMATAKPSEDPLIPAGVTAVLDALPDVPPESHAEALLLLAESNQKLDRATKLKFIREALEQATMASAPVKMARGTLLPTGEADRRGSASGLNLDRVSLVSRAIMDLAPLDPPEARKLGDKMRLPEMPAVGCKNVLVYDVKAYYTALQALARNRKHVPGTPNISAVDLLTPAVRQLQTHTQVPLVLQLLSEAGLSPNELETLNGLFVDQLSRLREDERGFSSEMLSSSAIERVSKLYRILEANSPGSGTALLREFRQYLVANYHAGGCGALWNHLAITGMSDNGSLNAKIQNLRKAKDPSQQSLPDSIQRFNDTFHDVLDKSAIGAIQLKEIDTDVPDVAPVLPKSSDDPDQAALDRAAKQLRFDGKDQDRTESDRESSAWRAQAISFIGRVDDWEADPSSEPLRRCLILQRRWDFR
jgi:hypothetical protein